MIVSREMKNVALVRRIVAQDGKIRAKHLKRASLTDTEKWSLKQSVARLKSLPLFFTDDAVSLEEVCTLVQDMAVEVPLALLVVDYLQLIRASSSIRERRHQVEAVSQGLKTLAIQYNIPVLCLSSLARAPRDEKPKPPTLSDLRESGELEHDADIILLLHRLFGETDTSCHIAKNRDGETGYVSLNFRGEYVSFDEAAKQEDWA